MSLRASTLSRLRRLVRRRPAPPDPFAVQAGIVLQTGLFDGQAYLAAYPDVAEGGLDPLRHYVEHGAGEGRRPNPMFDPAWYRAQYPDVAVAGADPLLHYAQFGWKEQRNPCAEFDAQWYADTYLGELGGGIDPLRHYLAVGREQGVQPRPVLNPAVEAIRESGLFDAPWYLAQYPDLAETGVDPLRHFIEHGAGEGRNPNPFFDTRYYLRKNRDVAVAGANPLLHFIAGGWKELRNPHPEFDVWWYWSSHLDPASEEVNPLAHYLAIGRERGLQTRPARPVAQLPGTGARLPAGRPVRRICLFAAYDPDGLVDDVLIAYLRELSRHADVHLLADCEMQPGELDKLAGIVASARAERHGEYDFGSWSRLAKQVGWDAIARYDELLFVNDSCYLLRELDHVFARMDARPCDWWGMQATKGMAATRGNPRNRFLEPIPLETVRAALLDVFESDYRYDFHVGSYFLAFRAPVIADAGFRRQIEAVTGQESKRNVILKYEAGLTRRLIAEGFAFDTFIDALYPFHPVYTNWYFQLLDQGYPLLKRYLLANNHYRVRRLWRWKDRVLHKVPGAGVDAIERHLRRTTDPEQLERALHVGEALPGLPDVIEEAEELLGHEAFLAADLQAPKYAHWWGFPVCAFTGVFSGNERAVFEEVKDDPAIRKIIFTRDREVVADGANVEVVPLESPRGQQLLMRCAQLFVKHSPTRNLVYPVAAHLHTIINLWHGIPLKRIGHASLDMRDRQRENDREHLKCRAVISSSKVDTLAMAASFYPLSFNDIWPTGLPRNDFILREEAALPTDMQDKLRELRGLLGGRRLLLFMPTFRNAQDEAYYRYSDDELARLADWLARNDVVLGIREHMADSARVYTDQLARLAPLDLGDQHFPDAELLYREAAILLTDYSSCFIDFMLTGKPAISFAYDLESYATLERGLFYDLEFAFPGPVCRTFAELEAALEGALAPGDPATAAVRAHQRALFFDHVDDRSAARVVERVRRLADLDDTGARLAIGI